MFRRAVVLLIGLAALLLASLFFVRWTPLGLGFQVPSVLAQTIFQQKCQSPFSPIVGPTWQVSNNVNGQLIQWGCLDNFGNIAIANRVYVASASDQATAIKQAIADLTNGGTVDASGITIASITSPITIGTASASISLIVPSSGTWTLSGITNGTDCFFKVLDGSTMIGHGAGNGSSNKFTLINGTSSVNADSMICTDPSPVTGGNYVRIEGIGVLINQNGGTYTNGLLNVQKLFDASSIRDLTIANSSGIGVHVFNACCGTLFEKVVSDGAGGTGARPLVIDGAAGGLSTAISFLNNSIDHAGPGQHEIEITGGIFTGPISFYNLYVEGNTGVVTATSHIQVTSSAGGISFYGGHVAIQSVTDTGYCIDNANSTGNLITVSGMRCQFNSTAHQGINDHVTSLTINSNTNGDLPFYQTSSGIYPGTLTFATLGSPANGKIIFCSDCNATCAAGGGTGRMCVRENGAWVGF